MHSHDAPGGRRLLGWSRCVTRLAWKPTLSEVGPSLHVTREVPEGYPGYITSSDLSTPVRRGMTAQVTSRPTAAQDLRDLARLRRVQIGRAHV